MNHWSKWLDQWLQTLIPHVPTYVQDTSQAIEELKPINNLPNNAFVFASNVESMYTNIETDHCLQILYEWLDCLAAQGLLPKGFRIHAIEAAMAVITRNNIFTFDNFFFLQLLGTAMGTAAAVMWAVLYYAYHKIAGLLPKYSKYLYGCRLRR